MPVLPRPASHALRRATPLALTLAALALAACVDVRTPQQGSSTVPAVSQPVSPGQYDQGGYVEVRRAPAELVQNSKAEAAAAFNAWRQGQGLAPLSRSGQLQNAAQVHSDDMARMNRLSHVGSDGSRVGARAHAQGYPYRHVSENVAMTPLGIDSAMELWAKSPSHRAAMLRTDVREFGLAQNGRFWTLVMGVRK